MSYFRGPPARARPLARRRRSSGRPARRRPSTTSPSSRRSRARTRTGTTTTATRTAASSTRRARPRRGARAAGGHAGRRATRPRWSRCRTSRRGRSCSRSRSRWSSRCSCSAVRRGRDRRLLCLVALARVALRTSRGRRRHERLRRVRPDARRAPRPARRVVGMVILIASEATLFAALIGTYFYLRFDDRRSGRRAAMPEPRRLVPIVLAARAGADERADAARLARGARRAGVRRAARCSSLARWSCRPATSPTSCTTSPTSCARPPITRERLQLDLLHAARRRPRARRARHPLRRSGCWRSSRGGSRPTARTPLQAIAWYWHFVNLLTLVVTATLLSARR